MAEFARALKKQCRRHHRGSKVCRQGRTYPRCSSREIELIELFKTSDAHRRCFHRSDGRFTRSMAIGRASTAFRDQVLAEEPAAQDPRFTQQLSQTLAVRRSDSSGSMSPGSVTSISLRTFCGAMSTCHSGRQPTCRRLNRCSDSESTKLSRQFPYVS